MKKTYQLLALVIASAASLGTAGTPDCDKNPVCDKMPVCDKAVYECLPCVRGDLGITFNFTVPAPRGARAGSRRVRTTHIAERRILALRTRKSGLFQKLITMMGEAAGIGVLQLLDQQPILDDAQERGMTRLACHLPDAVGIVGEA